MAPDRDIGMMGRFAPCLITQRRQHEGHNTRLGHHTDQGQLDRSQYDGLRECCDLSTGSEVFLIFTTPLYSCLFNCNVIVFIS